MMKHDKKQQQKYQPLSMQLPHLEPSWLWEDVFRDLETWRGRYLFLCPKGEEPAFGPPDLAHILPLANGNPHQVPLLVPSNESLTQFGLIGAPQATNLQKERKVIVMQTLHSARWLFVLEWFKDASCWDSLLITFDQINPVSASLEPALVPLTLFTARMADLPRELVFATLQAWAPILDRTQDLLLPLIYALYLRWTEGPSQAATLLRAANTSEGETSYKDSIDEDTLAFNQHLIDEFTQVFGSEPLETLLSSERLAPALLRMLDEISCSLWNPTTPLQIWQQSALNESSPLCALLPIALWRPQPPIALDMSNILSLEHLCQVWQLIHDHMLWEKVLKGGEV